MNPLFLGFCLTMLLPVLKLFCFLGFCLTCFASCLLLTPAADALSPTCDVKFYNEHLQSWLSNLKYKISFDPLFHCLICIFAPTLLYP